MNFSQRTRGIVQAIAVVLSLAVPLVIAVSSADARIGGGGSSGSRGSRTFSAPPSTTTAPGTAQPFNRTFTQPGSPGVGAPAANTGGGFFNRPGRGLLGGLAAGFLGAGLLGMLFGGGMFSGLGGLSSIFGLLLQIGLIFIVVRLAMSWWQRRHTPASAYAGGPAAGPAAQSGFGSAMGFGLGSGSAPLEIQPADYEAFERLLGEIQAAWSNEDVAKLHTLATPEMVKYLTDDFPAAAQHEVMRCRPGIGVRRFGPRPCVAPSRRWIATPAVWSKAAKRRPRSPKSGPSCVRAAQPGNSRRSSRPTDYCSREHPKALRFIPRRLLLFRSSFRCRGTGILPLAMG